MTSARISPTVARPSIRDRMAAPNGGTGIPILRPPIVALRVAPGRVVILDGGVRRVAEDRDHCVVAGIGHAVPLAGRLDGVEDVLGPVAGQQLGEGTAIEPTETVEPRPQLGIAHIGYRVIGRGFDEGGDPHPRAGGEVRDLRHPVGSVAPCSRRS